MCAVHSVCRPYGVASLLAVHDKEAGPQLYLVEPSGVLYWSGGREEGGSDMQNAGLDAQVTCARYLHANWQDAFVCNPAILQETWCSCKWSLQQHAVTWCACCW